MTDNRNQIDPAIQAQVDAEVQRLMGEQQQEAAVTAPKPMHEVINQRTNDITQFLDKPSSRTELYLPELSRRAGARIEIAVRRLTIQELTVSQIMPDRCDKLVSAIIARGMKNSTGPRKEYDVQFTEDDVEETVQETFGGWNKESVAAFFEFQRVVACLGVIDPNYPLYMSEQEASQDPTGKGISAWRIPDEDVEAIFEWCIQQEEKAANVAATFR